ncbi:MAG: SOS response-associated peptidase [Gammaproteobacteria bacterium]|nr:SOS response-associated peptidase [Gammaproteobacteria bacterium]
MCGRFTLTKKEVVKDIYDIEVQPDFNISPMSNVLVLTKDISSDLVSPRIVKWEYSPSWAKKPMHIFNVRSETLHEKPSFKESLRCVFVVDGWFEWFRSGNKKIPYYHTVRNNIFHLAGIYNKNGCAIVTKESTGKPSTIHHRQPVMLESNEIGSWLIGDKIFNSGITKDVSIYEVSTYMNSAKNNDSKCIQRV